MDAEAISRGETPEARLIPKHAFKRDVIIAAYTKDFNAHLALMRSMSWTVEEKEQRIAEVKRGFEDHVGGVRQMRWPDLDKVIALMKRTRTDLKELQAEVLAKRPYPFAEML